jgi:O-antigen ligase
MGRKDRRIFLIVPLLLIGFFLLPASVRDYTWRHYTNQTKGSQGSYADRRLLLQASMQTLVRKPLWGYGPGQSQFVVVGQHPGEFKEAEKSVHNVYMQVGMELGLFGLIPFLTLVFSTLKCAYSGAVYRSRTYSQVSWCMLAYILTIACGSFFLGNFLNPTWCVILGLATAASDSMAAPSVVPIMRRLGSRQL